MNKRFTNSSNKKSASQTKAKFKKEIFANTSFEETRIAIMEDDNLAELFWERRGTANIVGNIYKGTVENVLPGISSAFINIGLNKNAYIYISDVLGSHRDGIERLLKRNQHVMVQVSKDAIGTKGMKVTMDISLPGRYLVLTPVQEFVGVSKNIDNHEERKRLSEIIKKIAKSNDLDKKGCIVRTEAEGASEKELERELKYLMRTWESIMKRFESSRSPHVLHKEMDLTLQMARDILSDEVSIYMLNNKEDYNNVLDLVKKISPELKDRIRFYNNKTSIFKAFDIEKSITELRKIKIPLPNGGSIIIQEAESLCAIDVNTGRFTGSRSQEETVTLTNVEAAREVARQLRLRNIGGIVVIDFIDMKRASNRHRIVSTLEKAVKRDRAKIRILPITRLGLVEMTRERKRESTVSLLTEECPECHGSGRVLSSESIRIKIQREIQNLTLGRPGGNLRIIVHPMILEILKKKQHIIEKNVHRSVKLFSDPMLTWEDYKLILE
ncbi:MAG: Rne/Rng family ribonuclease [Elusimicrobiales bacterium]|nr:Rne/Rng family ribonuclease [Elusimicrobiales bacterium]